MVIFLRQIGSGSTRWCDVWGVWVRQRGNIFAVFVCLFYFSGVFFSLFSVFSAGQGASGSVCAVLYVGCNLL